MDHRKIKFHGEEYWLHGNLISPIDHFSENGELEANPLVDISYAVIEGNNILRYHKVIGTMDEVEYLS